MHASRILSYTSALMSGLTLVCPRSGWGAALLQLFRPLAEAWALPLAVAGALGGLIGLARRDRQAVSAGLLGALIAARHVRQTTAPHASFDQAFGPGWSSRIPPALRSRMSPWRYTPRAPAPPQVPWRRDVVVGTSRFLNGVEVPLLADIWLPPAGVPRTGLGVIYLHGSGWHYMDKDYLTRSFFRRLAAQGHVIVDLAYALSPKAQLGAMMADVKRAIAWLKENGARYGVDPERVVLMGGSAGGHLALLAAYTAHHPELQPPDLEVDTSVRAVVSYYGVIDLWSSFYYFQSQFGTWLTGRNWLERKVEIGLNAFGRRIRFIPPDSEGLTVTGMLTDLLGGTPDEVPHLYDLGSPIRHVRPDCPPTLLIQGGHDIGGFVPDARRLHQALRDAGVTSVYLEIPNTGHGFDLFFPRVSPAAQAASYDVERFLALMI
jgi:acetyl esterase/lipase